jgi:hypothetical protein
MTDMQRWGSRRPTSRRTVRLRVPLANLLTPDAMRHLMESEAARWTT